MSATGNHFCKEAVAGTKPHVFKWLRRVCSFCGSQLAVTAFSTTRRTFFPFIFFKNLAISMAAAVSSAEQRTLTIMVCLGVTLNWL